MPVDCRSANQFASIDGDDPAGSGGQFDHRRYDRLRNLVRLHPPLSGVVAATFSTIAVVRPGTNAVFTAAGETVITRISGPSTRASDSAMVFSATFDRP
jgi:hypothetical protein